MRPKFPGTKSVALFFAAAIALAGAGCGQYAKPWPAEEDEPMRRLKWENDKFKRNTTPTQAARQWFLPKYYFDSTQATQDYVAPDKSNPGRLRDHFPGMDPIAVSSEWRPGKGPTLDTPVFQLFDLDPDNPDKPAPEFRLVNPLETNNEVLGRNTWMLWCAGNEGFWDWLSTDSLGFIDLLKIVDSRNRATRFGKAGLINEPEMVQGAAQDQFGLWLDVPADGATRKWREDYLRRTFDEIRDRRHVSQRGQKRYETGSKYETRDGYGPAAPYNDDYYATSSKYWTGDPNTTPPPPEIYGLSSGVVGLRLFPNPNFDADARKRWDAARYLDEKEADYWNDPELVRPYRVGMACAFCHASYHPLNPPRDLTNPGWENISGNIGAQYLRIRAVFGNLLKTDEFIYHILDSQPPGTIDTSLIASDNINNPNAMNSVFNLPQRALLSLRNPKEVIAAASTTQPSIWRHPEANPPAGADDVMPDIYRKIFEAQGLREEAENSNTYPPRRTPRILLDGSDSIGAWGALARVYLNIGTYYEQWIQLHRVVVGFDPQRAFTIADCERHSVYWHATQLRVAAMRDYFLKATPPMPLLATPDASGRAKPIEVTELKAKAKNQKVEFSTLLASEKAKRIDRSKLADGRRVFARNCIVCHSSIQPPEWHDAMEQAAKLGEFWLHDPARWLSDPKYLAWAEAEVDKEGFWRLNYLSTDYRIPINVVNTNAGRALATNAIEQNMWDDFASDSYQRMPSVGAIQFFNPYKKEEGGADTFTPRHKVRNNAPEGGGGPGFYRVPTLVSIWATAPLLHNNSLGKFTNDPSVDGRLQAFDDAIRKLLWPERRLESSDYNGATAERLKRDHGLIWRTTEPTYLAISGRRVPTLLAKEVPFVMKLVRWYRWLKDVRPPWLPSGLLLLASVTYLAVTPSKKTQICGYVAVLVAVLITWALYYFRGRLGAGSWLDGVQPLWLPGVVLLLVGLVLLTLDDIEKSKSRVLAWTSLVVATAAFVIYLRYGYPRWFAWLENPDPLLLLSAILLSVGVVLVWRGDAGKTRALAFGRAALVAAVALAWLYALGWWPWIELGWWLALLIAILLAVGIVLVWPRGMQNTRFFILGCAAFVLAVGLYLLVELGWFSWAAAGHRLALLIASLLLVGGVLAWLGEARKLRRLGYGAVVLAVGICLLHAVGWFSWLGTSHRLGLLGAVLLLLAASLLILLRAPLIRILAFAILFLAVTSLAFSFILDYPELSDRSLRYAGPLWPLSVLLGYGAILFFLIPDHRKLTRWLGYTSLVLAIGAGFLVYFLNGRLGDFRLGPIPQGTPVNLLANVNPDADRNDLKRAIKVTIGTLAEIESKQLKEVEAQKLIREQVAPELMKVNKCPDFVMDKGHYFEWFKNMTDEDKEALIELLKTF